MTATNINISLPGTFRRTGNDEDHDLNLASENMNAESWKKWPNEAGFERLDEHRGPIDLRVTGHIPAWAAGSLYRTGPGQNTVETSKGTTHRVSHWFDGFAHTHKFDILAPEEGSASNASAAVRYSSRRQAESFVEEIKRKGWRSGISFGQKADPCVGRFAKFMSLFEPVQSNNSVVVERNVPGPWSASSKKARSGHRTDTGDVFILTDNSLLHKVDVDTLEPIEYISSNKLNPVLKGPVSCAHPQRDPETGDLFNFNLVFGASPTYRVFRANGSTGTTDILATLTVPDVVPAYIHSMFLTQSYVVLAIPSSHYAWYGIKVPLVRNLVDAMVPFDESLLTQWVVIDRRQGRGVVSRFTTPAGFFFHSINAFEEVVDDGEGGESVNLYFDHIGYHSTNIIHGFYLDVILDRDDATRKYWIDNVRDGGVVPHLKRYRFHMPKSNTASPTSPLPSAEEIFAIPAPHAGELPTINRQYSTKPYQYVYSVSSRGLSTMMDCLVKTDLQTREATIWAPPKSHTPGEAIFVSRPNAVTEDDGVLLSVILDGTAETSYLVCLDATTMKEMGRAELGFAIGLGFHGIHAPEK